MSKILLKIFHNTLGLNIEPNLHRIDSIISIKLIFNLLTQSNKNLNNFLTNSISAPSEIPTL